MVIDTSCRQQEDKGWNGEVLHSLQRFDGFDSSIRRTWETEVANLGDTRGGERRVRPARDNDEETANI